MYYNYQFKIVELEQNFHSLFRLSNRKTNILYTLELNVGGREDNNRIMNIDIMMCLQGCCLYMLN